MLSLEYKSCTYLPVSLNLYKGRVVCALAQITIHEEEVMTCLPVHADPWRQLKLRKHGLRVCTLNRGRRSTKSVILKKQMEMKNWKLYMENKTMILENENLKKKAFLLYEENKALLSQLRHTTATPPSANFNV